MTQRNSWRSSLCPPEKKNTERQVVNEAVICSTSFMAVTHESFYSDVDKKDWTTHSVVHIYDRKRSVNSGSVIKSEGRHLSRPVTLTSN